jgi:hypothetical protein
MTKILDNPINTKAPKHANITLKAIWYKIIKYSADPQTVSQHHSKFNQNKT